MGKSQGLQLVGGWPTPLKNHGVKVNWDDDSQDIPYKPDYINHKNHIKNHIFGIMTFPTEWKNSPNVSKAPTRCGELIPYTWRPETPPSLRLIQLLLQACFDGRKLWDRSRSYRVTLRCRKTTRSIIVRNGKPWIFQGFPHPVCVT